MNDLLKSVFVLALFPAFSDGSEPPISLDAASRPFKTLDQSTSSKSVARITEQLHAATMQFVSSITRQSQTHVRLDGIHQVTIAKHRVDSAFRRWFQNRKSVARHASEDGSKTEVVEFLTACDELLRLSGRLNYQLRVLILDLAVDINSSNAQRRILLDQLIKDECRIGGQLMAPMLIDPPAGTPSRAIAATLEDKRVLLSHLAKSGHRQTMWYPAAFLAAESTSASDRIHAAQTLVNMGLPQDPLSWKSTSPADLPITAKGLLKLVEETPQRDLLKADRRMRIRLMQSLKDLNSRGHADGQYHVAQLSFRRGDILLFRNASPYNRLTSLSPGLFTHVGLVTQFQDQDGRMRIVLVDANERAKKIGVSNVDAELSSPLFFAIMRPTNRTHASAIAEQARSLIGKEFRFDLEFQHSQIHRHTRQPLKDQDKIVTYCAGLVAICIQSSGAKLEDYFPLDEGPRNQMAADNLASIGISIERIYSPTALVFSPHLELVHFSDPMYSPDRVIEQATFDHFANRLAQDRLSIRATTVQQLRQQVANVSSQNTLVARLLAAAAGVDQKTDLQSAARVQTAIEVLDEIVRTTGQEYRDAMQFVFRRLPVVDTTPNHVKRYVESDGDFPSRFHEGTVSAERLVAHAEAYFTKIGQSRVDAIMFEGSH
ncbi:MAG: hypothetical protein O3A00_11840 [Planctomycetota bacterium]|nr:hypothetical protein [Planctomycetota bacterium]